MLFFIAVLVILYAAISARVSQPGFTADVLAEGLDTPWAIDFLPDGTLIFTERPGRVSVIEDGAVKVIGTINVSEEGESGLLGIAVDPGFEGNRQIYLYYTHEGGNRLSRSILGIESGMLEDETVLLDRIPSARFHDGGRLKFGPDGKLYLTTGDATMPSSAQDIDSLSGKILRLNRDGTVPEDNPFGSHVYSYGHRNPEGIAWDPETWRMYASEHGQTMNDEINIIVKGGDYGWPSECSDADSAYIQPIRCYSNFTLAPAGIAFYDGDIYAGGLRGSQLRRIVLGSDRRTVISEEELFSELGRIREVVERDGYLYISTSNRDGRGIPRLGDDRIIRLKKE